MADRKLRKSRLSHIWFLIILLLTVQSIDFRSKTNWISEKIYYLCANIHGYSHWHDSQGIVQIVFVFCFTSGDCCFLVAAWWCRCYGRMWLRCVWNAWPSIEMANCKSSGQNCHELKILRWNWYHRLFNAHKAHFRYSLNTFDIIGNILLDVVYQRHRHLHLSRLHCTNNSVAMAK